MKANIPKGWHSLTPSERERISEMVDSQINHEEAELQKIWLQMACIVLHNGFKFGKRRCSMFLYNWKRIYQKNSRLKTKKEQSKWLEEQMAFFDGEYPKEFIDKMEEL